ncbi:aspartyl/asparaginyl beta-hydroxylase domain-containing protein [Pseudomonas cichorii]|uniref:aspartyl/asparaginyl beta-hydroxylase domain-containing protein n=1 Tax=Pseudomonas cichorii TaxID=36746 RepID=UPI001C8A579A|nr:aspartyl/asparaginyl beta-hydroxylase domain-containing protein [Pseudomonas cichorii]MBX8513359.1 aspartyl/asparaginyl beta-hydroxylase domain-containing protein [Pseudomonas cichorii]MBX8577871.1 aspartyl/asparaginyl beta-hydroxylase domain-containing protein [Pseudomonas cichorii]
MRPSFYEACRFPQLENLARNWEVIRDEFQALNAPTLEINRVNKSITELFEELTEHVNNGGEYGWLWGWGDNDQLMTNWTQYALVAYDQPIPYAREKMPRTLELLSNTPGIKLCALLRLEPNVFLGTHSHGGTWEEGLLHMQLTIDAPTEQNYNYLNVNGQFSQSVNGNLVVFDGSLDHFAVNASNGVRTVMYMEFYREQHMVSPA